jgi:uncharacterized protein (TIRG00374 family)
MNQSVKRNMRIAIGVVISVAALVLALLGIDLRLVLETLAEAEYLYLIPATVGILLYLFARAIRWRILLGPKVSLLTAFWVTNIGYLVSNVLPFRLGDPARAVVVGLEGNISTAAALSTVVVERVLDMLMVVVLLLGLLPFLGQAESALGAGLIAGAAALVAFAVLLFLAFKPDWGRRVLRSVLCRVPFVDEERWAPKFDGLFEGLAPLRSGRRGLALLGWTVIVWACVVVFYWFFLQAFMDEVPVLAAPFLVCTLGLGMAIPSSPGALGVFEAVARYALTIPFAVSEDHAVAAAFGSHAFQYILMCLLGLLGLARQGLSLRWVRERATEFNEEEA